MMQLREIFDHLHTLFREAGVELKEDKTSGYILIPAGIIRDACRFLKDKIGFDYLSSLSGVERPEHLEVVYHLASIEKGKLVTLKVNLSKDAPELDSIEPVFSSAGLFERETYEMFGIRFNSNSNLRRLLLPEDWTGFPLRKDYKYPEQYHGILHQRGGSIDRSIKK